MYNEDYRYYKNYHYIHWTDISTWDFKECTCAKTKHIKRYFTQPRFFAKVEFMDNAKEVLSRLKDKYEIVIVSMGIQPNLFGKEIWIKDNLPFAKFIGVDMEKYKDKSCINMSDGILIDDEQRYLDSSNANVKICFGDVYEWNEYWEGKRCFNWIELENYLMEGSINKIGTSHELAVALLNRNNSAVTATLNEEGYVIESIQRVFNHANVDGNFTLDIEFT